MRLFYLSSIGVLICSACSSLNRNPAGSDEYLDSPNSDMYGYPVFCGQSGTVEERIADCKIITSKLSEEKSYFKSFDIVTTFGSRFGFPSYDSVTNDMIVNRPGDLGVYVDHRTEKFSKLAKFMRSGLNVIKDRNTGLIWTRATQTNQELYNRTVTYEDAKVLCKCLDPKKCDPKDKVTVEKYWKNMDQFYQFTFGHGISPVFENSKFDWVLPTQKQLLAFSRSEVTLGRDPSTMVEDLPFISRRAGPLELQVFFYDFVASAVPHQNFYFTSDNITNEAPAPYGALVNFGDSRGQGVSSRTTPGYSYFRVPKWAPKNPTDSDRLSTQLGTNSFICVHP